MTEDPPADRDAAVREDLAEALERRAGILDDARAEAVDRRHGAGRRTARENIADLVDAGSFVEYGGLAIAAQRARRDLAELIERTPADGLIAGTARVNGELFGERAGCAVLSYDYMVLAGTQGAIGHRKKDRLFELIERMRLPVIFFAEGGGGRPGDTDYAVVSALDTRAFALWARLSGLAPRIAIVSGRCFAGNAVLAGSSDLIVATEDVALGMGGPAMIAGGGLGEFEADEIGPIETQSANGVVDVHVADEAAAVAVAKRLLSYFQGPLPEWSEPDPALLRDVVPERRRRAYDVHGAIDALADEETVTYLREGFAKGMVTALARLEGRAIGIVANNPMQMRRDHQRRRRQGRALPAALRRLRDPAALADRHPGDDGRPRGRGDRARPPLLAAVRHRSEPSRAAGRVDPAQGLRAGGAGDGGRRPARAAADSRLADRGAGSDGARGAVRLGARRELDAIADPGEREAKVQEMTAALHEHAKGLNAATLFELDDVIDPADSRRLIAATFAAAAPAAERELAQRSPRPIDTW